MIRHYAAVLLYWICYTLDQLPWRDSIDRRWYRHYGLGCLIGVAGLAMKIEGGHDERPPTRR